MKWLYGIVDHSRAHWRAVLNFHLRATTATTSPSFDAFFSGPTPGYCVFQTLNRAGVTTRPSWKILSACGTLMVNQLSQPVIEPYLKIFIKLLFLECQRCTISYFFHFVLFLHRIYLNVWRFIEASLILQWRFVLDQ